MITCWFSISSLEREREREREGERDTLPAANSQGCFVFICFFSSTHPCCFMFICSCQGSLAAAIGTPWLLICRTISMWISPRSTTHKYNSSVPWLSGLGDLDWSGVHIVYCKYRVSMLKQKGLPTLRFWFWEILRINQSRVVSKFGPRNSWHYVPRKFKTIPVYFGCDPPLTGFFHFEALAGENWGCRCLYRFASLGRQVKFSTTLAASNIFSPRPQFHDVPRGYPWCLYVGDQDNHG